MAQTVYAPRRRGAANEVLHRALFPLSACWSQVGVSPEIRSTAGTVAGLFGMRRTDLRFVRLKTCFVFADAADRIYRTPAVARMRARFRQEYRLMDAVRPHLPVAMPVAELAGDDPPVARYQAIPGEALPRWIGKFRDRGETGWLDDLAGALVALHDAPVARDGLTADFVGGRRHVVRQLRGLGEGALADETEAMIPVVEAAAAASERCLCHGDLKGANVLVDPRRARITGLIDFGGAGFGVREWDLARLRLPTAEHAALVERYEALRDRPLDRDRLGLFVRFETLAVHCRRALDRHRSAPAR